MFPYDTLLSILLILWLYSFSSYVSFQQCLSLHGFCPIQLIKSHGITSNSSSHIYSRYIVYHTSLLKPIMKNSIPTLYFYITFFFFPERFSFLCLFAFYPLHVINLGFLFPPEFNKEYTYCSLTKNPSLNRYLLILYHFYSYLVQSQVLHLMSASVSEIFHTFKYSHTLIF